MAVFNFYNRISSTKIVSSSDISRKTKTLDSLNKIGKELDGGDDEYTNRDYIDDLDSLLTEETGLDEVGICEMIHRNLEVYDELSRSVEKFTDSAISPDDRGQFLHLHISGDISDNEKDIISSAHKEVINLLGFSDHIEAWKTFFEWASYGKVAYRIHYDMLPHQEHQKKLQGLKKDLNLVEVRLKESKGNSQEYKARVLERNKKIVEINTENDRGTIIKDDQKFVVVGIKKIEKINFLYLAKSINKDNGQTYWKYQDNEILSDNEIVIIKHKEIGGKHLPLLNREYGTRKISYAHKIVRSYNILQRMEVTTVAWTVLNAMYRQVSTIPVTSRVAAKAKETISKVRNKYLDTFVVDNDGKVKLNGETTFNYMKHITLGNRQGNRAEVGTVQWSGFDMSNMRMVEYFRTRFEEDTRLPKSRRDPEGRSGGLTIYKADGIPFDEVFFYNYLDRNLHQFAQLIKKPTKILAGIKQPLLLRNPDFNTCIGYKWESMNGFFEAKRAEQEAKKLSNIDQMLRFQDENRNPIFPPEYLFVERTGFMTKEEWDNVQKYKNKDENQ